MKSIRRLLGLGGGAPALRVLMVCSGNICRSPTAEGVLRVKLQAAGLADRIEVDSAGTQGLHAREAPDPRAQALASRRGYDLSRLRARRVVGEDFVRFHRILAMDEGHLEWLQDAAPPDARARVGLLMAHAVRHRNRREVPDPYYGSERDFELVLDLVEDACEGLARELAVDLSGLPPLAAGNA
jgi:protein-tyrosine phosphatase